MKCPIREQTFDKMKSFFVKALQESGINDDDVAEFMSYIETQKEVVCVGYEAMSTIQEVKKSGFYLNLLKNLMAKMEQETGDMPGLGEYLDSTSEKH